MRWWLMEATWIALMKLPFLMQSSGLEGGVGVYPCVCVDPVASWHGVISAALLISPKYGRAHVCVCVRAATCMCGYAHCISVPFWMNSLEPFKHSCTRFILSLWGYRDHPILVHCSRGVFPFPFPSLNTHPAAQSMYHPHDRRSSHICHCISLNATGC